MAAALLICNVAAECPSAEDLNDQQTEPDVAQVDPDSALLSWGDLWPDVDWAECFVSAKIVSNSSGVFIADVEDLSAKELVVPVEEPCEEIRYKIIAETPDGEEVESFSSRRGFKTFRNCVAAGFKPISITSMR